MSLIQADVLQLFSNLFKVTDRILGSGAYGEVRMAIDNIDKRQMACKMVKLHYSPYQRSGRVRFSGSLWREVELLKDMSHVSQVVSLSTLTYQMSSQTSYTSSVSSSARRICMMFSPMPATC